MIGEVFSEKAGRSSSARSLYVALTEIAADRQSDRYAASQPEIAIRARLSVATVRRLLPVFNHLGLVKIEHNSIRGIQTASTYTIIRGPLAHHERTPAHLLKTRRATKKESVEEGTARRESVLGGRSTWGSSLAGEDEKIGEGEW